MIKAEDFWKKVNIGPNLTKFSNEHPEFADFWTHCPRADWMYWLVDTLEKYSGFLGEREKQNLFYENHEKFWQLYTELFKRYNLDNKKELSDDLQKQELLPWISDYIDGLKKEFKKGILTNDELKRKSWIGSYVWLSYILTESTKSIVASNRFTRGVMARHHKVEQLRRNLTRQEEDELEKSLQKEKEKMIMEAYKEQAELFRKVLGSMFK